MINGQSESVPFLSSSVLNSVVEAISVWSLDVVSGAVFGVDGKSDSLGTSIASDVVGVSVFSDRLETESDFGFIT